MTITDCRFDRKESTGIMISITTVSEDCRVNITIFNSSVSNHNRGGIVIEQTSKSTGKLHFHLIKSIIEHNSIDITENRCFAAGLSIHCETPSTVHVHIADTQFVNNEDGRSQQPATVYISMAHSLIIENSEFIDNYGTAILINHVNNDCEPEKFIIKGSMRFAGNRAYQGGALSLLSAVMSIKPHTSPIFENNTATDVGGAIYTAKNGSMYSIPRVCSL